jgi:hypothetical protein
MKLAILLCTPWRGGMLRYATGLARVLSGLQPGGIAIEQIIFGVPSGAYAEDALFADRQTSPFLADPRRFSIRSFTLRAVDTRDILLTRRTLPDLLERCPQVLVPDDGGYCFRDCDAAVLIAPFNIAAPILLECPYVSLVADLLLRYVPAFLRTKDDWQGALNAFLTLRVGRAAFATTPSTAEDVVGFAGVPRASVVLVPLLLAPPSIVPRSLLPGQHILWVTNPAAHKNHRAAVAALEEYYGALSGTLPTVVVGPGSDTLGLAAGCLRLPWAMDSATCFHVPPGMLDVRGYVPDHAFRALVANAAIVWHNVIADNGSYLAFDAATAGRHLVSSDYPQMRYWCDRYGIEANFFPAHDHAAAANALRATEAQISAGVRPMHALRADNPDEIADAYTLLLERLL